MGMIQRERPWSRAQRESLREKVFQRMILCTSAGLGPRNRRVFFPSITGRKAENVRTDAGRWVS